MIQARCGSSRLPNKVMKPLCGKPVLERVIERVQKSTLVDEVVVITSIDKQNLPILGLCAQLGVRVGVGSEQDVLDRYYQTAKLLQPEYVIRITADCPCFDSELLDMAIRQMDSKTDYCGMLSETFADGLDLEIMKFSALQKAWREASHSFEREHVTQYIVRHPDFENVPKILETPYIPSQINPKKSYAPYKYEIEMLRRGIFDPDLKEKILKDSEQ